MSPAPPPIDTVLVIDPPGYAHGAVFAEVADGLAGALTDLGSHARCVRGGAELSGARTLVLGANLLAADPALARGLHPDAVLFNLEQIQEHTPWCGPELLSLLRRHTVVDYSRQNIERLRSMGIHGVGLLEIGHHSSLERIEPGSTEEIDVLFYGSLNERRSRVLAELERRGLHVYHAFGVYGAARDALIARSKVVLNVHHYDARVFEIVRVSYLLANGRFVVSESGGDHELEAPFSDGLAFADYDELADVCHRFVQNPGARAAVAARGRELMRARPQTSYLAAAFPATAGIRA